MKLVNTSQNHLLKFWTRLGETLVLHHLYFDWRMIVVILNKLHRVLHRSTPLIFAGLFTCIKKNFFKDAHNISFTTTVWWKISTNTSALWETFAEQFREVVLLYFIALFHLTMRERKCWYAQKSGLALMLL